MKQKLAHSSGLLFQLMWTTAWLFSHKHVKKWRKYRKTVTWSQSVDMSGTTFLGVWINEWFRWFLVDYVAFSHFLWWKVAFLSLYKCIVIKNIKFLPFLLWQMWNYLQTNPYERDLSGSVTWSVTGTQTIVRIYTQYMIFQLENESKSFTWIESEWNIVKLRQFKLLRCCFLQCTWRNTYFNIFTPFYSCHFQFSHISQWYLE